MEEKPVEALILVSSNDIKEYLREVSSLYGWDFETAHRIMMCESGGNPKAHNFSHSSKDDSYGLFQVNLYGELAKERPSSERLLDPKNNIDYAYKIYKAEGWYAWANCFNGNRY